jgi:hypothetical protein
MTSSFYTPSGRVPFRAVPVTLLLAVVTLPSGCLYALLLHQLPTFLNPIAALAFAFWLGYLAKIAVRLGAVRRPVWAGRAGMAIGLLGWYCQWAAWASLRPEAINGFIGALGQPWYVARIAAAEYDASTLGLFGWHIGGPVRAVAWVLELLLSLQIPSMTGRIQADEPFCERCSQWARKIDVKRRFASLHGVDAARDAFEADATALRWMLRPLDQADAGAVGGDVTSGVAIGAAGPAADTEADAPDHAEATLYRCACAGAYLSLRNVAFERSGKGATTRTMTPVVDCLHLPDADADALLRTWAPPVARGHADADVLAPAIAHLQADRHAPALAAALPFAGAAEAPVRADANRVCALACSRLGRWRDAARSWQALFDDEPTTHNAMQVASSLVMAGDLAGGTGWFERAQTMNGVFADLPDIALLTNFVSALTQAGQMAAALPYVDAIRQVYVTLGVTDATFLSLRGVPFFSAFLDNSYPVIQSGLAPEEGRAWYAAMLPDLDARGQADLNAWLDTRFGASVGTFVRTESYYDGGGLPHS